VGERGEGGKAGGRIPLSKTTGKESTHASTRRGAVKQSHALDCESVVRFAETLKLRSLAPSTQAEYLRYLRHVPVPGQHRVRHFGWLHPSATQRRMRVETLLQKPIIVAAPPPAPPRWHLQCPHCARFTLVRVGALPRQARAPPWCAVSA
jgi:hypothetical protein